MKRFVPLVLLAALALLLPATASAQPGLTPCDCDFCYANPYATCIASPDLGSGPCGLYYYLFCYPWHEPGQNVASPTADPSTLWRPATVADLLLAGEPAALTEAAAADAVKVDAVKVDTDAAETGEAGSGEEAVRREAMGSTES
ncbi:MAG: hypothetical protein MI919_07245 [Holophagales bacterium]|nr:hypothetical protein [Holophagales bacterium]